jgi:hypothetical protein
VSPIVHVMLPVFRRSLRLRRRRAVHDSSGDEGIARVLDRPDEGLATAAVADSQMGGDDRLDTMDSLGAGQRRGALISPGPADRGRLPGVTIGRIVRRAHDGSLWSGCSAGQ